MQWTIEAIGPADVELRMSAGVHSGECHFFLTETPHRELIVAGPGATRVFELEDLATAGEIVLAPRPRPRSIPRGSTKSARARA